MSAYKHYFDVPSLYELDPNITNTDWFESDIVISALVWHTLHPAHDNRSCLADIALNSKVFESEHARLVRSARVIEYPCNIVLGCNW